MMAANDSSVSSRDALLEGTIAAFSAFEPLRRAFSHKLGYPPGQTITIAQLCAALVAFWESESAQAEEALHTDGAITDDSQPDLPVARIKRIMKADEDVKMLTAESSVLMAKAVELFVQDLSIRYAAAAPY